MDMQTKTLSVRVRDRHCAVLNRMAFDVNQVWNEANAWADELAWVPVPEVGYINAGASAFDLQKDLKGIRKQRNMLIGSSTFQEVIAVHAKSRRQFKRNKLRWRKSGGAKRSLGWVPFKAGAAKWVNGQVKFCGRHFKVWDSYGLSGYKFRSGSFSQDARGRWYFNVVVHVPVLPSVSTSAVGIDLGLKDAATCSDGMKFEGARAYRKYEDALGEAQRRNQKKKVKRIHAKIKNVRKDAIHKFTHALVRKHALIVVGNVSSKGLAKTKMAKSVLDASWSKLKNQLKYKAIGLSGEVLEVNEAYTTQACSSCGCISHNSPKGRADLNKRKWVCSDCGAEHDRDVNAAINILNLGLGCQAPCQESPCL